MDDRGYIAQALFDRLRGGEVEFRVLGNTRGYPDTAGDEIDLAVHPDALRSMPRAVARFCHEFDLQLVQLLREAHGWHFVLAWSDDVGRPHFLVARVFSDFYVGARRLLRSDELLRASPDVRFIHGLATTVESGDLAAERIAWLSELWHEYPRAAMERIAQLWRKRAEIRIIAHAAKHGDWTRVRSELPRLRRALRRGVRPRLDAVLTRLGILAGRVVQPPEALIAFIGPEPERRSTLMRQVARELAPAFPTADPDAASLRHRHRQECGPRQPRHADAPGHDRHQAPARCALAGDRGQRVHRPRGENSGRGARRPRRDRRRQRRGDARRPFPLHGGRHKPRSRQPGRRGTAAGRTRERREHLMETFADA